MLCCWLVSIPLSCLFSEQFCYYVSSMCATFESLYWFRRRPRPSYDRRRRISTDRQKLRSCCWKESAAHMWVFCHYSDPAFIMVVCARSQQRGVVLPQNHVRIPRELRIAKEMWEGVIALLETVCPSFPWLTPETLLFLFWKEKIWSNLLDNPSMVPSQCTESVVRWRAKSRSHKDQVQILDIQPENQMTQPMVDRLGQRNMDFESGSEVYDLSLDQHWLDTFIWAC